MSKIQYTKERLGAHTTRYKIDGVDWDRQSVCVTVITDDEKLVFTGIYEDDNQLFAKGLTTEKIEE